MGRTCGMSSLLIIPGGAMAAGMAAAEEGPFFFSSDIVFDASMAGPAGLSSLPGPSSGSGGEFLFGGCSNVAIKTDMANATCTFPPRRRLPDGYPSLDSKGAIRRGTRYAAPHFPWRLHASF